MGRQKLFIDETARVFCAFRVKDVDIETCLACRRLEKYDLDSRRPYLVCRESEDVETGTSRRPELQTAV